MAMGTKNNNKEKSEDVTSTFPNCDVEDPINFDNISMRCFKQIELSSSSIFQHPYYFFPEFEKDPGIYQAFNFELPIEKGTDDGRENYIKMCKNSNIVPLKRVLNSLDKEELDLRYYGLRTKELKAVFGALETNTYVRKLILQDNVMDEEAVQYLSNLLSKNEKISILDIKQCEIGPNSVKALCEGFQTNITLVDVDLSFNSLGDSGIISLKEALKNNESIEKLNLGHNNLTSYCASGLQQFLADHFSIEDINLEWNMLSDDYTQFRKLIMGLAANPRINSLNLSWNGMDSEKTARALKKYIQESETLEFLDLSHNGFRERAAKMIKTGITKSTSLKHFKFGSNPLNADEAAAFASVLMASQNLEIMDLENINFNRNFKPNLRKIKRSGKTLIIGDILGDYTIKGPNVKQVLLKRCNYLGLKPKRAKAKRDFAQIVLSLPEQPMDKKDFEHFVRKKNKARMYDLDLLGELCRTFASGKSKIDTQLLQSEYKKMYPDIELIPKKKKGKGDKKGKRRKVLSSSSATTTTTVTTDRPEGEYKNEVHPEETKAELSREHIEIPQLSEKTDGVEENPEEISDEINHQDGRVKSTVHISEKVDVF